MKSGLWMLAALALLLILPARAETALPDVALPADYEQSICRYPVLYLLPQDGLHADDSALAAALTEAMANGAMPMILVRPAIGAEDDPAAVLAETVAAVDAAYRTIPDASHRAAIGTGVGGYLSYALTLGENSPFGAAISIRGDFASDANPWLTKLGSVADLLEKLHAADEHALDAIETYLDAPVDDAWTDQPGSTDDLGAQMIGYGTGSASHEFTVRAGVFDDAFVRESVARVLRRLTARFMNGVVSGSVTAEKSALTSADETIAAAYQVHLGDAAKAYGAAGSTAQVTLKLTDGATGAELASATESHLLDDQTEWSGRLRMENRVATSANLVLSIRLLGAEQTLGTVKLIRLQDPVADGEIQHLDLMGDWAFNYVGPQKTIDVSALTAEEIASWSVVQPGLASWSKGFGNISDENVTTPGNPDYFNFFIVGSGYYARTFTLPQGFDAKDWVLSVGYVDDRCEVFLNGKRIGATGMDEQGHPNGETTWAVFSHFDIDASQLNADGENTVVVRAWNDLPYGGGGWYGGPIGLYSKAAFEAAFGEQANPRFYEESFASEHAAKAQGKTGTVDNRYLIYLPKDYFESDRYYPTVYLLHQFNSDHTSYRTDHVDQLLEQGMAQGLYDDMIVVIPNSSEESWWKDEWEKMITDELIPHIDSHYRAIPDSRFRLTAGCSMGGQGAFGVALRNPNLFSGAVSFFGAFSFGAENSPNAIATAESADYLKHFALYFICGNQDSYGFGVPAIQLHQQLEKLGVEHRFFIENGGHDSVFYLPYFQDAFTYIRKTMFHTGEDAAALLSGSMQVSGSLVTANLQAADGIAALLPSIPASTYTETEDAALRLPLILRIEQDGKLIGTRTDFTTALTAENKIGGMTADLKDWDGIDHPKPVKLSFQAALLDRMVDLAEAEVTLP